MVYDYQLRYSWIVDRVLGHKHAILVHLNWACIFLGLHSFGLYIHNDTMNALGRTSDMFADTAISLQPIFAQWIQHVHLGIWGGSLPAPVWSHAIYSLDSLEIGLLPVQLGTADFMVHHIHAFTIHVTALILLKGVLFARNSRLIPDKAVLGFRFPCDGPGRGGTCQVSAWDHVFLGLFWMYNSIFGEHHQWLAARFPVEPIVAGDSVVRLGPKCVWADVHRTSPLGDRSRISCCWPSLPAHFPSYSRCQLGRMAI